MNNPEPITIFLLRVLIAWAVLGLFYIGIRAVMTIIFH